VKKPIKTKECHAIEPNQSKDRATHPEVYYYTSGTLNGLHGTIGTENGTLNGLHGMIGTGNRTLNGFHGMIGTFWLIFQNLHFGNSRFLLSLLLFIY
jgi:hypothetical protein